MAAVWIFLLCVVLGALGFAGGIVYANPVLFIVGIVLLVAAAIGGAKGSFPRGQTSGSGHH